MDFIKNNLGQNSLIVLIILSSLYVFKLNCLVSALGWTLIFSFLSWNIIKCYHYHFQEEFISPKGKAVVVTGCDSGFGYETAKQLNSFGFTVFALCLSPDSCDLKQSSKYQDKIHLIRVDVTNDDEIKQAKEQIKDHLEQNNQVLWTVVNNAGLFATGEFEWGSVDNVKRIFEVNVFGVIRVTKAFLPLIRKSKGRIVNLASVAGRLTGIGLSTYSMTKHSIIALSDSLRREMDKWSVKVITIEPEAYRTPMANEENILNYMNKTWDETDESVKSDYGNEYIESYRKYLGNTLTKVRKDPNEVVQAIVKAATSETPQTRYACCGYSFRLLWWFAEHFPSELTDELFQFTRRSVRVQPRALENQ